MIKIILAKKGKGVKTAYVRQQDLPKGNQPV